MVLSRGKLQEMATPASLFSVLRTMFNQLVPRPVQQYLLSVIRRYWKKPKPASFSTLTIDEKDGMSSNHLYKDSQTYLSTKIIHKAERLNATRGSGDNHITLKLPNSVSITDDFQGIELKWRYVSDRTNGKEADHVPSSSSYFELTFKKEDKDKIVNSYLLFVVEKAEAIRQVKKVLKLQNVQDYGGPSQSVKLEHPSTFNTLAMDPSLKKAIMNDLDLFAKRKDFYKKVGKAWKRGYLLYGPPGTGKSSLIAAMANYLKFDNYDLRLSNVRSDSCLRNLMLRTANRSILVLEDIDCSVELTDRNGLVPVRSKVIGNSSSATKFSLSELLNFVDGLWSSCGHERIIIFATNNKDKLDPALLRPGRMDMHIHMSYLTSDGFKVLASNYLDITDDGHWRFEEIKELIDSMNVTPAQVAEQLMKSSDADVALGGQVDFLKL